MEFKGKINKVLPIQSGSGKNGTWTKQEVIIETIDQYPKKLCVSFWNKEAEQLFKIGNSIHVGINVESREYNGKWFTEVKAWKTFSNIENGQNEQAVITPEVLTNNDESNPLPF